MIFDTNKIPEVIKDSFSVERNGPLGTKMIFKEGEIDDGMVYIEGFCEEMLNLNFNSILVVGLGLGIIPQYIAENALNCKEIDVLDNNNELIDWVTQTNYLNSKINIIEGDCFTYVPPKKHDLILIDIWWDPFLAAEKTEELVAKYSEYLDNRGDIYIPLLELMIPK